MPGEHKQGAAPVLSCNQEHDQLEVHTTFSLLADTF